MAQAEFESLLKDAMGLDAASIGSGTVERAVGRRMATLGLRQTDEYWRQLRSSTEELQELIEAVVVPETWFYRDREAFSALERLVTEEWRPSRPTAVLRLLSAPCSTGEEPYSMVMSLLDCGFSPQQIHVDAVDISARALARATRGLYGPNSFRGGCLTFRERYFQLAANDYALADWLRKLVTFRQGNLLASDFGVNQEAYDVIFCRNLLIYFDRPTQELIMKKLARLLTPGGFLFVGPAEAFLASRSGFAPVNQSMSFAFRKVGALHVPAPHPAHKSERCLSPRAPRRVTTMPGTAPVGVPTAPPPSALETARRLADAGQLEEAAACCEANLSEAGPSAEAYFLLGLIRDAMGDRTSAAAFYRRVIYLQPKHVEALIQLALLSDAQGDTAAAGRFRARAQRAESAAKERVS